MRVNKSWRIMISVVVRYEKRILRGDLLLLTHNAGFRPEV